MRLLSCKNWAGQSWREMKIEYPKNFKITYDHTRWTNWFVTRTFNNFYLNESDSGGITENDTKLECVESSDCKPIDSTCVIPRFECLCTLYLWNNWQWEGTIKRFWVFRASIKLFVCQSRLVAQMVIKRVLQFEDTIFLSVSLPESFLLTLMNIFS